MDDRGSTVRFVAGAGNFPLHLRVHNGSGVHPASYPMGTKGSFLGGKAAGAWSWQLTSIKCQGQRMSGAQLKHRDNFSFKQLCNMHTESVIPFVRFRYNYILFYLIAVRQVLATLATFSSWRRITLRYGPRHQIVFYIGLFNDAVSVTSYRAVTRCDE
jgi:hypothetical protein